MSTKSDISRFFKLAMLTVCSTMIIGCSDNSPKNTNSHKSDATNPSAVSTEIMREKSEADAKLFSKQVRDFCKLPKAERIKAPSSIFTAKFLNAVAEVDESYYREDNAIKDVLGDVTPAQIKDIKYIYDVHEVEAQTLARLSFATFSSISPDKISAEQLEQLVIDDSKNRKRIHGYELKINPEFISDIGYPAKRSWMSQVCLIQYATPKAVAALEGEHIKAEALNFVVGYVFPDAQTQHKGDFYDIDMDSGVIKDPNGKVVKLSSFKNFKNVEDLRTKITVAQLQRMDIEELKDLKKLTLRCMTDQQKEAVLTRLGLIPAAPASSASATGAKAETVAP